MGFPGDLLVPASGANLPSLFKHPILRLKNVWRRIKVFSLNTMYLSVFWAKGGGRVNFVQMKQLALENFIAVNTAFAKGREPQIADNCSILTNHALKERLKHVDPNIKMSWELLRYNRKPRIVLLQPLEIPNAPSALQAVYRIDSRQRLTVEKPGQEPQVTETDLVQYPGFVFDTTISPPRPFLIGSLFETPLTVK
ncbi:hypothetical protein CANCADRAFT_19620, partial [Tortispora caseinolytica NRRL Y-17796]